MNCFEIKYNSKIQILLDKFFENVKESYPEVYTNYKKCQIEKVAGWPCSEFDLTMIYFKINYDGHHPNNRHKEIQMQTGEMIIDGISNEFEFSGSQNIIDRFRFPKMFHKSFEFDRIEISKELKPIKIRNTRARKKFKNSLKKDIKEYQKLIDFENLFLTDIKGKIYLSLVEFAKDKFLSFDRKYNAYILEYKEPKRLKDNENQYRNFTEMSTTLNLNQNINQILKSTKSNSELKSKIAKIAGI